MKTLSLTPFEPSILLTENLKKMYKNGNCKTLIDDNIHFIKGAEIVQSGPYWFHLFDRKEGGLSITWLAPFKPLYHPRISKLRYSIGCLQKISNSQYNFFWFFGAPLWEERKKAIAIFQQITLYCNTYLPEHRPFIVKHSL